MRRFCEASGIPQSEAKTNPAGVTREYKSAYRDMLRTWEKHRLSLDTYDYSAQPAGNLSSFETVSAKAPALTLQQAIDMYVYESKRAGTSTTSTVGKKTTSLGLLTELFGPDILLATLTKQDAQHAKKVLLELPIHDELLRFGFLDYHAQASTRHGRLFPDYSYCQKNGYGRALGRWFNATLTPALGIKSKHHVFHGFRHTMITRLAQADVEEPIYQSIVGHERQGVT